MFNIIEEITTCYKLKADAAKELVKLQMRGQIKESEKSIVKSVLQQEIITFCYKASDFANVVYPSGQISFDVDDIEWDI
jgi:hypothetical protein